MWPQLYALLRRQQPTPKSNDTLNAMIPIGEGTLRMSQWMINKAMPMMKGMMAMLTWITMRERRKFSMPDRQEISEVEVGEEDGVAMVRVTGEEGLDDNPSRTSKELNKEPHRNQTHKVPLQLCKAVLQLPLTRCPTTTSSKALA